MMKTTISILVVVLFAFLAGGCSFLSDDGRMAAWKEVRKDEEKSKQEALKAKQAELATGRTTQVQRNPTLKVTTQDSAGQPVVVEMDLAPTIAAATGNSPDGSKGETYGIDLVTTKMPASAASEDIRAIGAAAKDIGGTPAAVGAVVGASVGAALRETGGGGQTTTIGGDGEVTQTTTKTTSISANNETEANGDQSSAGGALPPDTSIPVGTEPVGGDTVSSEPVIVSEN